MDKSKDRILKALKRYKRGRTKSELMALTGCWNIGARVLELRQKGHEIETVMEVGFNRYGEKTRYARYVYHA